MKYIIWNNEKIITVKHNEEITVIIVTAQNANSDINLTVDLKERNSQAKILGIVVGRGNQEIKIFTRQIHTSGDSLSDLLVKSVMFDSSSFSYDGLIRIEKKAQKSNAYQRNENLVLSDKVRVNTKPELEIEANDVRCTHGATIGKIDEEQVFYLTSRGLTEKESIDLIIKGFFEGVVDQIKDEKIKKIITAKIEQQLN